MTREGRNQRNRKEEESNKKDIRRKKHVTTATK